MLLYAIPELLNMADDKPTKNNDLQTNNVLIFDETKRMISAQFEGYKSLTNRLQIIIGFNSVVVAAILQSGNVNGSSEFIIIGLMIIVIAILLGLLTYTPKQLENSPSPIHLYKKYKDQDENKIRDEIIKSLIKNYSNNETYIKVIKDRIEIITLLTAIGIVTMSLQIILKEVMLPCLI